MVDEKDGAGGVCSPYGDFSATHTTENRNQLAFFALRALLRKKQKRKLVTVFELKKC